MMDLLYLAKATFCLSLFWGLYKLLLERTTHFHWSRAYLVGTAMLSLILPLLAFPMPSPETWWGARYLELYILIGNLSHFLFPSSTGDISLYAPPPPTSSSFLTTFLIVFYVAGVMLFTLRFLGGIATLLRLIHSNPRVKKSGYTLVHLEQGTPAFSFLWFIFVNPTYLQGEEASHQQILHHERTHVRQLHTLDVLLFEVLSIVFWFNPLMRWMKQSITDVHEYIADAEVVQNNDRKQYARLLVDMALPRQVPAMSHTFSQSEVGKRVSKLHQARSSPTAVLRVLLLVPLTALLLVGFSFSNDLLMDTIPSAGLKPPANEMTNPSIPGNNRLIAPSP